MQEPNEAGGDQPMHAADQSTPDPSAAGGGGNPFDADTAGDVRATRSGRVVDTAAEAGERQYALWTHLGPGIAWIAVGASSGMAFLLPALVALVLWLARRHDSPFLDDHGRQAVNFQISLLLLTTLLVIGLVVTCVGLVLLPAVAIGMTVLSIVGTIMAALAANRGEYFRYPMTWELIRSPDPRA